jgi:hypothetical protein
MSAGLDIWNQAPSAVRVPSEWLFSGQGAGGGGGGFGGFGGGGFGFTAVLLRRGGGSDFEDCSISASWPGPTKGSPCAPRAALDAGHRRPVRSGRRHRGTRGRRAGGSEPYRSSECRAGDRRAPRFNEIILISSETGLPGVHPGRPLQRHCRLVGRFRARQQFNAKSGGLFPYLPVFFRTYSRISNALENGSPQRSGRSQATHGMRH